MADDTLDDLPLSSGSPALASLFEIGEKTDPLAPVSEAMELKQFINYMQAYTTGFWDYNDAATASSPFAGSSGVTYTIPNDTLGAFTRKRPPTGMTEIWNAGTSKFDFTEFQADDEVQIRLDIEVTTSVANQDVKVWLELNQSPGTPFDLPFIESQFKTAGAHDLNRFNGLYLGPDVLNNSAQFKIWSDAAFTMIVRGWYVTVRRRSLV